MGDLFTRNLKKQSARAKEKLLESLGKADKTTDEQFQEQTQNFQKQQKAAERLQKEAKNYVTCVRAMAAASRGFYEALREIYEPEWPGGEHVRAMSHSLELLWDDYCEKLSDQVLTPLNSYSSQFPDVRTKVAKRGRKLVDYDGARHNFDTLRANSKKPDEVKVLKAQEQLTVAKRIFDDINVELLDSLPALYDSRITFYVNNFQTIFNLEQTFHGETAKLTRGLCNQMDELGHSLGRLRVPRDSISGSAVGASRLSGGDASGAMSSALVENSRNDVTDQEMTNDQNVSDSVQNDSRTSPEMQKDVTNGEEDGTEKAASKIDSRNPFDSSSDRSRSASRHGSSDTAAEVVERSTVMEAEKERRLSESDLSPSHQQQPNERPVDVPQPPKLENEEKEKSSVLYKVRATHRYTAEDMDELSFEAGEVIAVVAYDDPEEQDEGWLMGIKEASGEKGVFPANFTKPI